MKMENDMADGARAILNAINIATEIKFARFMIHQIIKMSDQLVQSAKKVIFRCMFVCSYYVYTYISRLPQNYLYICCMKTFGFIWVIQLLRLCVYGGLRFLSVRDEMSPKRHLLR